MNNFKTYVDSLLEVWNEAAPAARVGILLLSTLCLVALAGVGYWSAQPSYVTLISETDAEKMDRVIDALDKSNIKYELSGAGGNLRVSKSDFSKARLLARGAGAALEDSSNFGMGNTFGSPADRKRMATLRQQLSLAKTIQKMNVVDQADVHLSLPERGPFERKTSMPTASVMLTLVPGSRLSEQQASSIASIVAFSVEDLQPEAVQISDKEGRSYTMVEEGLQQINSQIEYVSESERKLARKAEAQLVNFLGLGNASVQVSLDLTFTNGSTTTVKYDAEGKVPSTEDLNTSTTTGPGSNAIGPAGVESNLAVGNRPQNGQASENKTETIKTSYLVPKTEETLSNTTPIRNFMSVSVIVNQDAESLKLANGTPEENSQRVRSIVENAVGFKQGIDTISVELLPFPKSEDAEVVEVPYNWQKWTELVRNASLAIAAIVAFLIGFMVLKKIKPLPGNAEPVQLSDESSASVQQLSALLRENPAAFGQMLAAWSGESNLAEGQNANAGANANANARRAA